MSPHTAIHHPYTTPAAKTPIPTTRALIAVTTQGFSSTNSVAHPKASDPASYSVLSVGASCSPIAALRFSVATSMRCLANSVVFAIVSYASEVAPALSCISPSTALKLSAPLLKIESAPTPASVELHSSLNAVASPSTLCPSMSSTSPREEPFATRPANDVPVCSFNTFATVLPLFPSSFKIALRYVPASAVATPFAVNTAYAAPKLSISTP